jgi:purine-nucleoside phosphorylase
MLNMIKQSADFLASKISESPQVGMITGTGLDSLTGHLTVELRVPYNEIPNFPESTVEGHKGTLAIGRLGNRSIMAMEGRFHLYEGYTTEEITFPVRVMAMLGIKYLLISSAAGGLNPEFETGDLMVVTDHINMTGRNPLVGPNMESLGPRFPDMSDAYDSEMVALASKKAQDLGITLRKGVYVGLLGPSLETPAEIRFLRMIGSDAVGMSTVCETIVGVHCGLKVTAIVVITNMNLPDRMQKVSSIEEIVAVSRNSGPVLMTLWKDIIQALPE